MGDPLNRRIIMETRLKWMILGYSYFRKPPFKPTLMFNPEG